MSETDDPILSTESLVNARIASRWLADYQRRLLTYLRTFEDGILKAESGLEFVSWTPLHHWTVPEKSTKPFSDRTTWHFLPLLAVWLRWQTNPKKNGKVVGAARVDLHVHLDSGWKRGPNKQHPDPLKMDDAAACCSPVHASATRIFPRDGIVANWEEADALIAEAPPEPGQMLAAPAGAEWLLTRRLKTDLALLPNRSAVEKILIAPLAEMLKRPEPSASR